jgi:enamine deaminase RidA (YjgF/YER057c/UK114 family)
MASPPDVRIQELHLILPNAPKPLAVYKPCLQVGSFLYVSGHGPLNADGSMHTGIVGKDLTLDQGKAAARQVSLAVLATVKTNLGSLNKVKRLVKTLGWVASANDFTEQPKVMNGWSELMREVFGEDAGVGVRSAIGTNVLPGNIAVEVECLFELN